MAYNQHNGGGRGGGRFSGPKRMYSGEWTCMECQETISELPFNPPADADDLLCNSCLRKKKEEGFKVDMECEECGTHIDSLPFRPREGRPVTCKDCHMKSKGERRERRMIEVEGITCKKCSADITELPFEPRDPDDVLCRKCHMEQRNQF